jgi:hypothetical protein
MKIRFLLDEHMPKELIKSVKRYDEQIDILRIGLEGGPPLGMRDSDILLYCEAEQCVLITGDRATMPGHVAAHLGSGRHHWGVFTMNAQLDLGQMAYQLAMFWGASEAEEWIDQQEYLPY